MFRQPDLKIVITLLAVLTFLSGCATQSQTLSPGLENETDTTPVASRSADSEEPTNSSTVPNEEAQETANAEDDSAADDEEIDDEEIDDEEMDEFEEEFEEAKQEVSDPLEGYNRAMTTFNDKLLTWVVIPVGKGYAYVIPEAPRRGVRNFFHNLLYPIRLINNVLQFKLKNAGEETLRFVTNTTIGIFGFWDPAREWFGLEAHNEDFGQTLGFYGVGAGPHLVLPFFGPRNLRDAFAMYPDSFLDPVGQQEPIGQTDNYVTEYGVRAYDVVNDLSLRPGEYESLKKDAVDFYPFLRDSYEQRRNKLIKE